MDRIPQCDYIQANIIFFEFDRHNLLKELPSAPPTGGEERLFAGRLPKEQPVPLHTVFRRFGDSSEKWKPTWTTSSTSARHKLFLYGQNTVFDHHRCLVFVSFGSDF